MSGGGSAVRSFVIVHTMSSDGLAGPVSVTTPAELDTAFRRSLAQPGPFLIEAVLPVHPNPAVGGSRQFRPT